MPKHAVDVIVPVHSERRPIRRAVASVVDGTAADVLVTVVAHNIDPALIRDRLGDYAEHPRVDLVPLADGIASPAGPMNHGIATTTAEYYAVLGSDDEFEAGAVDAWLEIARAADADAVIARVLRTAQGPDPQPPTRCGRTRELDAVRDRLSYRCAPLGLISRRRFGDLRFTPGLGSGEDQEMTAQMWFTGAHLAYAREEPGYLVHEDGDDRVTAAARSVDDDFRFLQVVGETDWYTSLSSAQKRAWGVKNLRMHLMDAVAARLDDLPAHAAALVRTADAIEALSPGATALLARCDRAVLRELREAQPDPDVIKTAFARRWGRNLDSYLTANPFRSLNPQAPYPTLRAMVP